VCRKGSLRNGLIMPLPAFSRSLSSLRKYDMISNMQKCNFYTRIGFTLIAVSACSSTVTAQTLPKYEIVVLGQTLRFIVR
jgi:hypothetical protein